jgi:predicted ester cyclase
MWRRRSMTTKEQSRRVFDEIYTKGNLELIEETHDPHCKLRDPSRDTVLEGPEAIRRYVQWLRQGFPDFRIEVERQIQENDLVATQAVCHGTHDGPFMGMEPTHNPVHTRCLIVQRFRDNKVLEAEVMWDVLGFLNRLGLAPARAIHDEMETLMREEPTVGA